MLLKSMNSIEILSEGGSTSQDRLDSLHSPNTRQKFFLKCVSKLKSSNKTILNTILIVLGIRVPRQDLYDIQEAGIIKKTKHIFSPFRLYSLFIVMSLCILPVNFAIDINRSYSDEKLLHLISESVLPIQYLLAIHYYASTHIQFYYDVTRPVRKARRKTTLTNIRDIFVDINTENKVTDFRTLLRQPCRVTIRVVCWIVLSLTIMSFIGSLVTSPVHEYNKCAYGAFLISRLYGRGTCILNTAAFAFVFYKHIKVLRIYAEILEKRDWSKQSYDKVSVMLINLTRLRESLRISTYAFKNMFSIGTIAGSIIIGVLIHSTNISDTYKWSYDSYMIVGLFLILQSVVFGVIAKLSLAKEMIENVTKSSQFATNFLSRESDKNVTHMTSENASTLDYYLIIDILSRKWLDFSVMGIPVHSISFLKQCVSLSSVLLVLANTGTFSSIINAC